MASDERDYQNEGVFGMSIMSKFDPDLLPDLQSVISANWQDIQNFSKSQNYKSTLDEDAA